MNVIASTEGSLYELMCRGKKDTYFYEDGPKSVNIFDTSYKHEEQIIRDVRRIPPTTGTDFGKMIEFPVDIIGDVIDSITLYIQLPSWFPASITRSIESLQVADLSGTTYGYVNGIAFFLFEKIQLYQDTTIIQDFSGDYLWASGQIKGTYENKLITDEETGTHDGSPRSIGRNAVPGSLRLRIPLVGTLPSDKGFPLVSTTSHVYKLRCKLRRLEDLIESSSTTQGKPSPWEMQMQATSVTGTSEFTTLSKGFMAPLRIELETQYIFLTNESKDALRKTALEIPFIRTYENISTQTAVEASSVGINRRIDACHPSERMIWFFRDVLDVQANRLWKVSLSFSTVGLTIAGRSREASWSPSVWRDVTNYAKEEIDSKREIYTMNWGIGCVSPQKYEFRQADGSINFTTADRPTLYMTLGGGGATELRVFVDSWGAFLTDGKGRAEVLSFN
jgi:hypothetical protein